MANVKNYGVSVRDKLKKLISDGTTYQQILIRYMHERLLYRLSESRYRDNFYLKGGALLFAYERFAARPTIDIDFLGERVSRDKDNIKRTFAEILSIPCAEDGVTFDTSEGSITVEDIILEREYNGVKVRFTGHLDTIVQNLSMDIGFGDIIIPHPVELEYAPLIEDMSEFTINAYSLETVVAEKFQTMIARSVTNSRMKDFYDVYTILQGGKLDKEVLATAIKDIFENRGTRHEDNHPLFSEAFRNSPDKLAQWSAFLRKTKINNGPSFATVMDLIGKELKPYWEGLEIK